MRRRIGITLSLLLLLVAARIYSLPPELTDNYYSDNTYTTAVGWTDRMCDGSFASGGSTSNWRFHEITACGSGSSGWSCQEWDGTRWVSVECPDPETTMGGRLRVPVG